MGISQACRSVHARSTVLARVYSIDTALFFFRNIAKMGLKEKKLEPLYANSLDELNAAADDLDSKGAVVNIDRNAKQIGMVSAMFLIANRIIGAGVFSTPSLILTLSGSVGTSLILWVAGAIIAASGLLTYMELGTAIPRNGGEKNYLEYIYTKPKFLVTAMYGSYVFFLGWAAGNSVVTGEFLLKAAGKDITGWNSRGIGLGVITFAFLINSIHVKSGLILLNILGLIKIIVIVFISVTGWVALAGGIKINNFEDPHNFQNAFSGEAPTAFGVINALYNVIWSYVGYSNANYALGEIRNPQKVLRIAAPFALLIITILYIFVNIAYFAVVPSDVIRSSGRIVASSFFKYVFGEKGETVASVLIALSTLGNVLAVTFAQGRIIQQLGREGSLPFSRFFASLRPFNSPAAGLFQHYIICVITIIAPPPGDAYNFILNLISYPLNVVNMFVGLGLLYLKWKHYKGLIEWAPPVKVHFTVVLFFTFSSIYLVVAPYIPPSAGQAVYEDLPYYIHCVVTWGIFAVGGIYFLFWAKFLPHFGKYTLAVEEILGSDGFWRNKFLKIPNNVDPKKFAEEAINEESLRN